MDTRIRRATPADSESIGAVHLVGWRDAYRGLIPDRVLDTQTLAERTAAWRSAIDDAAGVVLVAETGTAILGFVAGGPRRGDAFAHDGELYAIHVRRTAQRAGVGGALARALAVSLRERGFGAMALWVLRENLAARQFYAKLGGRVVATRDGVWHGHPLTDVAYGWADLREIGIGRERSAA